MTVVTAVLVVCAVCFIIATGHVIYNKLPEEEEHVEEQPRDDKVTWWPDDK